MTQNSPDIQVSGLSASQSAHTGLAPVCAPFVPKGLFYVNRSVYLFSLNHFNAFICWVELKRILDCHKRSGIIPAICHSFFHCCHCRISGSHQIPVIPLPIPPDRCSFRNFGLNLFYEHLSIGVGDFLYWQQRAALSRSRSFFYPDLDASRP